MSRVQRRLVERYSPEEQAKDKADLMAAFSNNQNAEKDALSVFDRLENSLVASEEANAKLIATENATQQQLEAAKKEVTNSENKLKDFVKLLPRVADDLDLELKKNPNLDIVQFVNDRTTYYQQQAEEALRKEKERDENETTKMINSTMCKAAVEKDANGVKFALCKMTSVTDAGVPNLPDCVDGQNEMDMNGNKTCHKVNAFTNVFEFKGRKERKIENFSQNQKCKARY